MLSQRNEKIQKRQAVRGGDGVRQQVHRVLTEAALQTVWQLYEKYANASPLLERYAEDGGGTGSSAAGARRSERRRWGTGVLYGWGQVGSWAVRLRCGTRHCASMALRVRGRLTVMRCVASSDAWCHGRVDSCPCCRHRCYR